MRKPKIYLETTMFNYYFDTDRDGHADTVRLFKEIQAGRYEAYTSLYVIDELEETKDERKRSSMIALIGEYGITVIPGDDEAQRLAAVYIGAGIIPATKSYDSLHIAIASINDLDYIFSFNFQHINRIKTKTMTGAINVGEGYKPVTIATPGEVVEHGENK
jgi:predicted nucleic acid-binding protein